MCVRVCVCGERQSQRQRDAETETERDRELTRRRLEENAGYCPQRQVKVRVTVTKLGFIQKKDQVDHIRNPELMGLRH